LQGCTNSTPPLPRNFHEFVMRLRRANTRFAATRRLGREGARARVRRAPCLETREARRLPDPRRPEPDGLADATLKAPQRQGLNPRRMVLGGTGVSACPRRSEGNPAGNGRNGFTGRRRRVPVRVRVRPRFSVAGTQVAVRPILLKNCNNRTSQALSTVYNRRVRLACYHL